MFRRIVTSGDYAARSGRSMAWFLQRITGFLLAFTLIGHFIMVHIRFGSGPMPVSVDAIQARFSSPVTFVYYLVFLYCAIWHGANGLTNILDDYVHDAVWRWIAVSLVWVVGLMLALLGTLAVVGA